MKINIRDGRQDQAIIKVVGSSPKGKLRAHIVKQHSSMTAMGNGLWL